ncbi:MAG: Ig-like domain-containing protein [Oscillospiraceae bacterium]
MATNRKPGSRPGLIHCDNCGEDYSSSYRRCPFCDEFDQYGDEYETERPERSSARGGGKRLAQSRRRGGGYTRTSPLKVISIVVSLAVILFAAWIVITKLMPLVRQGDVSSVDPDSTPSSTVSPAPGTSPDVSPGTSPDVPSEVSPSPGIPASDTATGFSLSKSEFSFSDRYPDPVTLKVVFIPAGSSGTVTWTSSDPTIVSVDENGKVSHGTKSGSATITATLSNGVTQTCTVYNQVTGSAAPSDSGSSGSTTTNYTINNPDFTFYRSGETYRLKVNNYSGGVTWSSSNTSVATVSSDGTCTAVGNGRCTVTGTLDNGEKVTAIVRVSF